MTPDSGQKFKNLNIRACIIAAIRDFFCRQGYLEVETPVRSKEMIPEAHIDAVTSENWFLQASPELCMKRLLCNGHDRIFQICRVFRKQERGRLHLPEFTLLEWYTRDSDYKDLMTQIECLVQHVAKQAGYEKRLAYQDNAVEVNAPWQRMTVAESFMQHAGMPVETALETGTFDTVMGFDIEPCLGFRRPCFLYDYPESMASLARLNEDKEQTAQRMELYICGIELANGFSELTDPVEQKHRFESENRIRQALGKPSIPMPDKFLDHLEAMPASSGVALGLDRLVMLFCNAASIDDVVAFTPEML